MQTSAVYPPGPADWRKSLLEIQRSPTDFLLNLQRTYGDFVHYRHGPAHCYLINAPDLIREVLVDNADQMTRPPVTERSIGRFLGHGLLTSSGDYHAAQRKTMQPMFTPSWIAAYAPTMQVCVSELLSTWVEGAVRDLSQDMADLTMNIIYRTVFGTGVPHLQAGVRSAIETLQHYSGEMLRRTPTITEAQVVQAVAQLDAAVDEITASHNSSTDSESLTARLLRANGTDDRHLTARQIRDEAVTLFVAGQETSANALSWLFYLLAQHPNAVDALRTGDEPDLIEWTILEALRLYPPAWLIGRTPKAPYPMRGYTIQPGDSLVISPYVLHRTAELFAAPDEFLPERFKDAPPRYGFLPFGTGPHVCIGQAFAMQEMTLTLTEVLKHWQIELTSTDPIEPEPLVTLQPKTHIRAIIHQHA